MYGSPSISKTFLLKWGFNPRFFRKYYLKGDGKIEYNGPIDNYKINLYGDYGDDPFIDHLNGQTWR